MRAKEEAFRILEAALSLASAEADEAEVCLGGGTLGLTYVAENQIQPAEMLSREVLAMRVVSRGRMARIVVSDLSTAGISEAAQQLRARVEHLPEIDQIGGFPPPQDYEEVDAYDPETETISELDREYLAGKAVMAATRHDLSCSGRIFVRRGSLLADGRLGFYAVANTLGLLAYHPETRVGFDVSMVNQNGAHGWAGDESFTISALEPEELVRSSVKRAMLGSEPGRLESGTYPAILEPAAVAELLRQIGNTAVGELFETGASFLSDRLGEQIVHPSLSIRDDHTHPLHRGVPFDHEGVARTPTPLIENGVAKGALYGWQSSIRHHVQATGHGCRGRRSEGAAYLVLDGGRATFSDLVGATDHGVLIARLSRTELLDARTLTVTGTTRDGLFLLQAGEPVRQLEPMLFTVSLLDVLSEVSELTGSTWAHGAVAPAIKTRMPLFRP